MTEPSDTMVPLRRGLDLSRFGVLHPAPFVASVAVSSDALSRAVDHVSNVEFVRWLDRAAELHCDALGFTRRSMLDSGLMWFVVRHEIDYVAEARHGDALIVATWVRDVQRVKSWRETLILRPADDTVLCRAATLWVYVNLATRRPARVPAELRALLSPVACGPQDCTLEAERPCIS
jgi:acyl-CoA thioester hydrolase